MLSNDFIVRVTCNGLLSHEFELIKVFLPAGTEYQTGAPRFDPVEYGQTLFQALFPENTTASRTLAQAPQRILLVAGDEELESVPWEYLYGPNGYLVLSHEFVRGLPYRQRSHPRSPEGRLQIVAVAPDPLDVTVPRLDVDNEWLRLVKAVDDVMFHVTLERAYPPTLDQLGHLLAGQRHRIVHFMGHGAQLDGSAVLYFENENGGALPVSARNFAECVLGHVFLVVMNACVSAASGPTLFSNLAAALVRQGIPYALGMRYSVSDGDSLTCAHILHGELARGAPVELAVQSVRRALMGSADALAIGVPVLYTALDAPAPGFSVQAGESAVLAHRPPMQIDILVRAQPVLQGRLEELRTLRRWLTGDDRPPVIVVHGIAGQGKTALVREAVDRFSYAWPGGIYAVSLANCTSRSDFLERLARFLELEVDSLRDVQAYERRVLARLRDQRTLLVLENLEELVDRSNSGQDLLDLIRHDLSGPQTSVLLVSRYQIDWVTDASLELEGLGPDDGARVFWESAPERIEAVGPLAQAISAYLDGHPLSLALLGGTFNSSTLALQEFLDQFVNGSAQVQIDSDDYRRPDIVYASFSYSLSQLDGSLCSFYEDLAVFHGPFLPFMTEIIFHSDTPSGYEAEPLVEHNLDELWRRGLLSRSSSGPDNAFTPWYWVPTTFRPHLAERLARTDRLGTLQGRLLTLCARLASEVSTEITSNSAMTVLAQGVWAEFEWACASAPEDHLRSWFLFRWGAILYLMGDYAPALRKLEQALEIAEGSDKQLELAVLNLLGDIHATGGDPQQGLAFFERALALADEVASSDEKAKLLLNNAWALVEAGEPSRALELYEQASDLFQLSEDSSGELKVQTDLHSAFLNSGELAKSLEQLERVIPAYREAGDRAGEASVLVSMATVFLEMKRWVDALECAEQALAVYQEIHHERGEATALNRMGAALTHSGRPEAAVTPLQRSLEISRVIGDRVLEGLSLSSIGEVFLLQGELDSALEVLTRAEEIRRALGSRSDYVATLCKLAFGRMRKHESQEAQRLLNQALVLVRQLEDRQREVAVLIGLGTLCLEENQIEQATTWFEEALSVAGNLKDRTEEGFVLERIAEAHRRAGQPAKALESLDKAFEVDQEIGDGEGEVRVLTVQASICAELGQEDRALHFYERALAITQKMVNRMAEADLLNERGEYFLNNHQAERSVEFFQQALSTLTQLKDRDKQTRTLLNLALGYHQSALPDKAIEPSMQALRLARDTGDKTAQMTAASIMAVALLDTDQAQRALDVLEQIWPLAQEVASPIEKARILLNWATACQELDQNERAFQLYEASLPAFRESGDRFNEAHALKSMAAISLILGQIERARSLAEQALMGMREVGDQNGEAHVQGHLAMVLLKLGDIGRALEVSEAGQRIFQKLGDRHNQAEMLGIMAALLYQHLDRPSEALKQVEMAIQVISDHTPADTEYDPSIVALQDLKERIQRSISLNDYVLTNRQLETAADNTVAVLTSAPEERMKWRQQVEHNLGLVRAQDLEFYTAFFAAILAILDGHIPVLDQENPYAATIYDIETRLASILPDVPPELRNVLPSMVAAEDAPATYGLDIHRGPSMLTESYMKLVFPNSDGGREWQLAFNLGSLFLGDGKVEQALQELDRALSISRRLQDENVEALTLCNIGVAYQATGHLERAISFFEQACSKARASGNRYVEARSLDGIGLIYKDARRAEEALGVFEEALLIEREEHWRLEEALTLNNMAIAHADLGNTARERELYREAIAIQRAVGDREGELKTLENMGLMYGSIGQFAGALEVWQQALMLSRDLNLRSREADVLSGMARIYGLDGHPERELSMRELALDIRVELHDGAGQRAELRPIANLRLKMGQRAAAISAFNEFLELCENDTAPAELADHFLASAVLHYQDKDEANLAIARMERALELLERNGLVSTDSGTTSADMELMLQRMRNHQDLYPEASQRPRIASEQIDAIVTMIVEAMTSADTAVEDVCVNLQGALEWVRNQGLQNEIEFFTAGLAILDGEQPDLPDGHPYRNAIAAVYTRIREAALDEIIGQVVSALSGPEEDRALYVQYLDSIRNQTEDADEQSLTEALRMVLLGANAQEVGQSLPREYQTIWSAFLLRVASPHVHPRTWGFIVQNTLAVLGSASEHLQQWRDTLTELRAGAMANDTTDLLGLLDDVMVLLDHRGDPTGLGENLQGPAVSAWNTLVELLSED